MNLALNAAESPSFSRILTTRNRAFSLVEVTLALAITSFVLLTLLALFPVGLKSNQVSVNESVAVNILTAVVADLQVSATNALSSPSSLASPIFSITPLPFAASAATPTGIYYLSEQGAIATSASAAYRMEVVYVPGAATASTVGVNLRIFWPALSTSANAKGRVETYFNFVRP